MLQLQILNHKTQCKLSAIMFQISGIEHGKSTWIKHWTSIQKVHGWNLSQVRTPTILRFL
jgi:hypothetical protein